MKLIKKVLYNIPSFLLVIFKLIALTPIFTMTLVSVRKKHIFILYRNLLNLNFKILKSLYLESLSNSWLIFDKIILRFVATGTGEIFKFGIESHKVYLQEGYLNAVPLFKERQKLQQKLITNGQISSFASDTLILGPDWVGPFGHISSLSIFPKMELLDLIKYKNKLIIGGISSNEKMVELYEKWYTRLNLNAETQSIFDLNFRQAYQSLDVVNVGHGTFLDFYAAQFLVENSIQEKFGPHFSLLRVTEEIIKTGTDYLEQVGLSPDQWFVVLHVRENKSDKNIYKGGDNAEILSYKKAIELILDLGGQVIRIGNNKMTPLDSIGIKEKNKIFDYATSTHKSQFLDIYFLSRCRYMIATASGPMTFPNEFGVPILLTNLPSIGRTYRLRGISTPKLILDIEKNQLLNINQMLRNSMSWNVSPSNGRFLRIDNSQEDIRNATLELHEIVASSGKNFWQPVNTLPSTLKNEPPFRDWKLGVPIAKSFLKTYPEIFTDVNIA